MRLRRAASLAALALTALLATACGGSPSTAPSPATGKVQQLDVFAACMRGHGVLNFYFSSSPGTSNSNTVLSIMGHYVTGVNPRTSQFGVAMKSCKHLLPGGGPSPDNAKADRQPGEIRRVHAGARLPGLPGPGGAERRRR